MSLFRCPLCAAPLTRDAGAYRCSGGHSFDVAKEGYVHLLPPNQKHSALPGDDRDMVLARREFLSKKYYQSLLNTICNLLSSFSGETPAFLDAGCGEGWYTAALSEMVKARGGQTVGVDLSKPAVKRAARRCPAAGIAVASVYRLPLADASVDVLVDCFSPLAAAEFARTLRPGGVFLYVVPGPRHLWELKELLYEKPYENEEKEETYPGFSLERAVPVESVFTLTRKEDVMALFGMTPYAWKTPREAVERLAQAEELTVTAQFRIHTLRRK